MSKRKTEKSSNDTPQKRVKTPNEEEKKIPKQAILLPRPPPLRRNNKMWCVYTQRHVSYSYSTVFGSYSWGICDNCLYSLNGHKNIDEIIMHY